MRIMRRVIAVVLTGLVHALFSAPPAFADLCPPGCGSLGKGSVKCRVCDHKPGTPSPEKPGKPGKPDLPACPPSKNAIPDGSDAAIPGDWVRVRCMEGSLVLLFWVEPGVNPGQLARSLLDEMNLGSNVEASPAVFDNHIVIGTRGGLIYGIKLK